MRRILISASAILVVIAQACAAAEPIMINVETKVGKFTPAGIIKGRIVSTKGIPIKGATVQALKDVGNYTCTGFMPFGDPVKTGKDGRFMASFLESNKKYRLRIRRSGYERKDTEWISVDKEGRSDETEVRLREAHGFIKGRVVDEKGKPIIGRVIFLNGWCGCETWRTDKKGEFRIDNLIPGEQVILLNIGETRKVIVSPELKKFVVKTSPIKAKAAVSHK